jgi:hypothetical protein
MSQTSQPDLRTRLSALAAFREPFEAPGFEFGHWVKAEPRADGVIVMGFYVFSPVAEDFLRACGMYDWVSPTVDWMSWSETEECRRLMTDPSALASATPDQLQHLLTMLVRGERFGDGTLAQAYDSGVINGIVRRVGVLLASMGTDPQGGDPAMQSTSAEVER